jgi:hypothetical protein
MSCSDISSLYGVFDFHVRNLTTNLVKPSVSYSVPTATRLKGTSQLRQHSHLLCLKMEFVLELAPHDLEYQTFQIWIVHARDTQRLVIEFLEQLVEDISTKVHPEDGASH